MVARTDLSRPPARRLRVEVQGAVQGVGFRPFVYRLATTLGLSGWVINDTQGVFIEVEGEPAALAEFRARLPEERPPLARIHAIDCLSLPPAGYDGFAIRHSDSHGRKSVMVLPDVAACADCLAEVMDPADRRAGYPFTNCTNCGPRFSIIQALPYDRPNTTMRRFILCPACGTEYEDPLDRRFHAQPNACPACGPALSFYRAGERIVGVDPLRAAAAAIRGGEIVAVKGLGGFHLMVDARNDEAVRHLRAQKPRRDKPFAVMVPDLAHARALCDVLPAAEALLTSAEAPIVLLPRRAMGSGLSPAVAPGNPMLGIMLPYTPLHHLLLRELGFPIVATSGNLSDEPICTDEQEAFVRLGDIASAFLVHDRPIARHVDDSVAWIAAGHPRLLRRARGFAPLPVLLRGAVPPILAVGAHLKNTVALSVGPQAFISQHIGDLETPEAMAAFERVIADFLRLYEAQPVAIAHDLHPDYLSTKWALGAAGDSLMGARTIAVQHHHAHLAACLADSGHAGPALGVTWDGAGYGPDGIIWGGEFLLGDAAGFARVAHLRPFRLPGGDRVAREPRRAAMALLWELFGDEAFAMDGLAPVRAFAGNERRLIRQMLAQGAHAPLTTSAGRLFDAVAALAGLHQTCSFEGQAAMALEYAADPAHRRAYPLPLVSAPGGGLWLDWAPMVETILADLRLGAGPGIISARFHNGLVDAIVAVASHVAHPQVALTGGCFQNRLLLERAADALTNAGFEVLMHRQVPSNDGGICLGQLTVAAAGL